MKESSQTHHQLLVIGGGAAGFFCALNAAQAKAGLRVMIAERTNRVLSKVRISGGGRCNLTHACNNPEEMSRQYPRGGHFVRKAFHQFCCQDTMHWFESRGLPLKTEADGRVFPQSDSSLSVIECLMRELNRLGVELLLNREVISLERREGRWQAEFAGGGQVLADAVCIACGGFPKSSQFGWLKATGHHISEPVPSLFTFNSPGHPITSLMGLSVPDARVRVTGTKLEARGPLLITHWGLSGPAVLRVSAWGARELQERQYSFEAQVNWLPALTEQEIRGQIQVYRESWGPQRMASRHFTGLPQRLWEYLLQTAGIPAATRWADLSRPGLHALLRQLQAFTVPVRGKTGFKEEFVTAGGILTQEVDPATMMSRLQPDLYFAGEILDVDGITGGYNFQFAWTSGHIAGIHMAASC
jgi:predicted Rossmann fold flavoprotein